MNTINTVANGQIECRLNRSVSPRRWFSVLWERARRQPAATPSVPGSAHDPWTSAVNQIDHLDAHVLTDIGAPRWVIDEVARRQQHDSILNAGRKW